MGELRQHRAPATEPLPVADDTAIAQIARLIVGTERLDVPVADLALPAHGLHDPQVLLSRRAAIAQHEHLMLNHHIEVEEASVLLALKKWKYWSGETRYYSEQLLSLA